MLIEFKVGNYRSMRQEQSLNLVASNYSDELPQNVIDTPLPGLKGAKLLKSAAIYGANASGKSNFLQALRFVVGFVRDSAAGMRPDAPTGAQHFKLDPAFAAQPSKFELHVVINGTRMLYGLELTSRRVTSEFLVAYPKGKPQVWFERDWNEKAKKYDWSKSTPRFPHDEALRSRTRENASFISLAAQFDHPQGREVWDWFGKAFYFPEAADEPNTLDVFCKLLENSDARTALSKMLKTVDLGIVDAHLVEKEMDSNRLNRAAEAHIRRLQQSSPPLHPSGGSADQRSQYTLQLPPMAPQTWEPEFIHTGVGGSAVPMEFYSEESDGTRKFASLLVQTSVGTSMNRIWVVDELETSLHPLLVREAMKWFSQMSGALNTQAQLLFTTHNPLLLDQSLLRRDQIWFTEKDKEGATKLYPLTDFKPRKDEALVKGYLSGRYGGIPFIPEQLTATA